MVMMLLIAGGNPFILINQLFLLWMMYLTYATMHFCQALMVGIFISIDLLQIFALIMKFGSLTTLKGWGLWIVFIYDMVATVWIWQAYSIFTKKFDTINGGAGMGGGQSYMVQQPAAYEPINPRQVN